MKRKIICSSILALLLVAVIVTLFFSASIETILLLKPDYTNIDKDALEIHIIDVGQGDAIAIRFPDEKTMLIDSGPIYGRKKFKDYLNKVFFRDNYNTFDYVFLTHSDADHSGNMEYVLSTYKVKNFFRPQIYSQNLEQDREGYKVYNRYYDAVVGALQNSDVPVFYFGDGNHFKIGESSVDIICSSLAPIEPNDFSPLLIVNSKNTKFALSGDMGIEQEDDIISKNVLPDVDLYKLAHHGSKYSNSYDFMKRLQPEHVTVSVGNNTYGHPASETLLRLAQYDEDYNKNTYSSFTCTLYDGNIVYYQNNGQDLKVMKISNLSKYLFIDYYIIVCFASVIIVASIFVVIFPKFRPKQIKNMKH